MSIKGKIATVATAAVANKIASSGKLDTTINSALNMAGKVAGMKKSSEYIEKINNNYLIVQQRSYSAKTIVGLVKGKTPKAAEYSSASYRVLDDRGKVKYKLYNEATFTDRDVLYLLDERGNKVGHIKEHLMPMGIPLVEKDVKKCTVYLGKDKLCDVKKYVSFGDVELEVSECDRSIRISHTKGQQVKIFYNKKLVSNIHKVPLNFKDGFTDLFVMEYQDKADEIVGLLLSFAVDIVNK